MMPAIELGASAQVGAGHDEADRLSEAYLAAQSRDFCLVAALLEERQRDAIAVLHAWRSDTA